VRHEDLATCISCGLCLNDCPTYRVLGEEADSPRGRIQLIANMVARPGAVDATARAHLEACLVCRACETACPSGVPFGRIMEGAREDLRDREAQRDRGVLGRLGRVALDTVAHRRRLGVVTALANVARHIGLTAVATRLGGRLGWAASLAPAREGRPFRGREQQDADVAFFAGCVMSEAYGDTQRATVRLLEQDGHRVTVPREQTCCGALHAHAGEGERARELARLNIDAFAGSDAKIAANAAGCGAHLKDYGELLERDPAWSERAKAFAARVRDVSEVLEPAPRRAARPLRVVYQDACHLAHGQRIRAQPRALLKAVAGVTVVDIADPERCCGSAGVYNLTHPEVARALQQQKVANILAASPDVVVSANPGCMLQISAGLRAAGSRAPVVHLARFLDDPTVDFASSP
jgi:glycolate oxidase iron-sulfur subunit